MNSKARDLALSLVKAGAVTIREVPTRVANEEVSTLPRENQPFLYSSGNWGPGYVTVKGCVSKNHVMTPMVQDLALKISEATKHYSPKLKLLVGNITGGVVPAWKLTKEMSRIEGRQFEYAYLKAARIEETGQKVNMTVIDQYSLAARACAIQKALERHELDCHFVAGMAPGMVLGYEMSELLDRPFVYVRDIRKKGGHKELITGLRDASCFHRGNTALVVGQPRNFTESCQYGYEALQSEGYIGIDAAKILQIFPEELKFMREVEFQYDKEDAMTIVPVGSLGIDVEELVNFAQTTCNGVNAMRNANFQVNLAGTLLYYDNPRANERLKENDIQMIYVVKLRDVVDEAEEAGAFSKNAIDDYRTFLSDPLGWQAARGLKPVEGGGTL